MFDAVLQKQQREQRYGAGVVLALLAYAAAIGAAVLLAPRASRTEPAREDVAVTLYTALAQPAPPPPPPPGPAASDTEPSRAPQRRKVKPAETKPVEPKPTPSALVEPLEKQNPDTADEVEPTPEPASNAAASETAPSAPAGGGGVVGGVAGGVVGGVVGGTPGGVVGGQGTTLLPFGPGMTRPEQVAGTAPSYSREALAARVEGKVLVRCVITTSGEVTGCQVIKSVPMLTDLVLASLRTSRFTPVYYRGRPQAIQYLFTFNFKLP